MLRLCTTGSNTNHFWKFLYIFVENMVLSFKDSIKENTNPIYYYSLYVTPEHRVVPFKFS